MIFVKPTVTGGNRKQSEIIPKIPEDRHCVCTLVTQRDLPELLVDKTDQFDHVGNSRQNKVLWIVFTFTRFMVYLVYVSTLNFEFAPFTFPRPFSFANHWCTKNSFFSGGSYFKIQRSFIVIVITT